MDICRNYLSSPTIYYYLNINMSLIDFFSPVNSKEILSEVDLFNSQYGKIIEIYDKEFPKLVNIDIAIIGVMDDRKAVNNKGCAEAPDAFRSEERRVGKECKYRGW